MHDEQDLKTRWSIDPVCSALFPAPSAAIRRWICTGSARIAAGNMTTSCKRRTRNHPATVCPCGHTAHYTKLEAHHERDYPFQKSR